MSKEQQCEVGGGSMLRGLLVLDLSTVVLVTIRTRSNEGNLWPRAYVTFLCVKLEGEIRTGAKTVFKGGGGNVSMSILPTMLIYLVSCLPRMRRQSVLVKYLSVASVV